MKTELINVREQVRLPGDLSREASLSKVDDTPEAPVTVALPRSTPYRLPPLLQRQLFAAAFSMVKVSLLCSRGLARRR